MASHPFLLVLRTVLFAIGMLVSFEATGQDQDYWKIQHINTSDGLSNRFVNAFVQDSRGYTWIATNFGLNRYDGYRLDLFTRERNQLQNNSIYQLYNDVNDHIWIMYRDLFYSPVRGIDIIDPISFRIQPLESYLGQGLPFAVEDIFNIHPDTSGTLFLVTNKKEVYQYNNDGL